MKIYFLFPILLSRLYTPLYNFDYPDVRRDESIEDNFHGTIVKDPYRWLEDLDSAETKKFVAAQNALTKPYLNQCPYRDSIRESLTEFFNYTKFGPMKKKGGKYFFLESIGLENQLSLFYKDKLDGEPQLLVNPNILSSDGTTNIHDFHPSPDGNILAFLIAKKGSDWVNIYFIDVKTMKPYDDIMPDTKYTGISWTYDNKGVFYSQYSLVKTEDENKTMETIVRQNLYYHRLGESEDILVVEYPNNPRWSSTGEVSHDGKYLLVYIEEELGPIQIHYIDLELFLKTMQPKPKLIPIVDNFQSEYYYITNNGNKFMFHTNRNAPNWRVVEIPLDKPGENNWRDIVRENPSELLEWTSPAYGDKIVLGYMKDVKSKIQILSLNSLKQTAVYTSEAGSTYSLYKNKNDTEFFFAVESILTPKRIHRLDFTEHPDQPSLQTYHETSLPEFNSSDYVLFQEFYTSKDGTKIPMFLAHKKNLTLGPDTPCLLYGYGGFNSVTLPIYAPDQAMFMKNFNGLYVTANIRGGGEYGLKWYNGGRLLNKQNTFDDFHAAAEHLIGKNYTSSSKLTIHGSSNGGLLVGASINQRPDLYGAALAHVGVMDITRFNKFPAGESWTSDYGNPENKTQFEYLLTYSPLHNVKKIEDDNSSQYPATLLFTADHDDRVVPSHSYKLIAEMQYTLGRDKRQKNPLFLLVQADAGHGSGKPISKRIEEYTDMWSFVCKALDLKFEK